MDMLMACFSSSTTMGTESEPRSISQHIDYRREAKEAALALAAAVCHKRRRPNPGAHPPRVGDASRFPSSLLLLE